MIVYQEDKSTFMSHVRESKIDFIIHENFKKQLGRATSEREVVSWGNSMQYMRNVLDDPEIPSDSKISIECQIPNTSKRIDFIITGKNADRNDCAVIVELKKEDVTILPVPASTENLSDGLAVPIPTEPLAIAK